MMYPKFQILQDQRSDNGFKEYWLERR